MRPSRTLKRAARAQPPGSSAASNQSLDSLATGRLPLVRQSMYVPEDRLTDPSIPKQGRDLAATCSEDAHLIPAPNPDWLELQSGAAAVMITIPHSGTQIPEWIETTLADPWLARKDTDWWLESLYDFAPELRITRLR